jgi:hypothetical protein
MTAFDILFFVLKWQTKPSFLHFKHVLARPSNSYYKLPYSQFTFEGFIQFSFKV